MPTTRADEINEFVDETLEYITEDVHDPELRLAFLEGLQKAWNEDTDKSLEKSLYMLALIGLIAVEKVKLRPLPFQMA